MNWRKILQPLQSRKVRTALATVIAAYAVDRVPGIDEDIVLVVLGVGVSLIFGTAIEDHGAKMGLPPAMNDQVRDAHSGET